MSKTSSISDAATGDTPGSVPARSGLTSPAEDLDALIAAAEWRVIEGDARVLRHGAQIRQRLASHGTQARLGALAVAGVAAAIALTRTRQRAGDKSVAPEHHTGKTPAQASRPSLWLVWLPVLLQLATSGSVGPARPSGWVGWVSTLLSASRRWGAR